MKRKLITFFSLLLTVAMLCTSIAFAADEVYTLKITLTGPDAGGVTQNVTDAVSGLNADAKLVAAVAASVSGNRSFLRTVFPKMPKQASLLDTGVGYSTDSSMWANYVQTYGACADPAFYANVQDINFKVSEMSAGTTYVLTGKGDAAGYSVTLLMTVYRSVDPVEFNDVEEDDWYKSAVDFVAEKGLMIGTSSTEFAPKDTLTRGMVATVIARYAGIDLTDSDPWYAKGSEWAKNNGIFDGTGLTEDISRQDMADMLYKYAKSVGRASTSTQSLERFSDAADISSERAEGVRWCVEKGIVTGSEGKFYPTESAYRCEFAVILARYDKLIK